MTEEKDAYLYSSLYFLSFFNCQGKERERIDAAMKAMFVELKSIGFLSERVD